ncbi:MAG TPA: hypothetical protein VK507_02930, partial [Iamia sp.]|nr:hypothetical protein [Iamia sp.]
MTDDDLRGALGRAAGAPDARPDLDELWDRGRGRRRRSRVLATAAAVAVVAGLAAGAVAVGAGGEADEGVVAGPVTDPVDRPAGAPPAEPTDGAVTVALEAGPPADGLPTAEPDGTIVATFTVPGGGGFGRPAAATWERWDGSTWVGEQVLQAELAGEPGSGAVLALDEAVTSGQIRFEEEVDRYPTPDGRDEGWYRICVPMHQYSGVGPTVPGEPPIGGAQVGPLPPRPDPAPNQPARFGATIWPCAQLRVPDAGPTDATTTTEAVPTTEAPPPEPEAAVRMTVGAEVPVGTLIFVDFVGEGA